MNSEVMKGYYKVPKEIADQLKDDLNCMRIVMEEWIRLHRLEKKQKRNHRAYRHIQDYMDIVCEEHAVKVKLIEERWKDLEFEELESDVPNEEASEPLKELAKNVAEHMGEKELNEILHGMVMMSSETLGMMQEDMIVLTEMLEIMASLYVVTMNGKALPEKDLKRLLAKVPVITNEISQRWEDAEIKVIA